LVFSDNTTVLEYLIEYFTAPLNYPNAVPELIPLILGAFILEVYFEKVNADKMERADPIGNALLWLSTGLALILETNVQGREKLVVFGLIGLGAGLLILEFMEKWRQHVKFFHSFVTPIYSIAYLSVILVATPLTVNPTSIKAGLIFMAIDVVFFYVWKQMIPVPNN
jgi:hypothetical protein